MLPQLWIAIPLLALLHLLACLAAPHLLQTAAKVTPSTCTPAGRRSSMAEPGHRQPAVESAVRAAPGQPASWAQPEGGAHAILAERDKPVAVQTHGGVYIDGIVWQSVDNNP